MTELKPCPFCGSKAILKDRFLQGVANRKSYWIMCSKCQSRIQDRNSEIKAVSFWNRRESEVQE
jgi:Lar family restriction alleviation protein